jgi:hypothetical protein
MVEGVQSQRHCGYDNCKCVFIFYVVLFHAVNNWYEQESTQGWPPFWIDFFKSYTLWHEKLAVPGFAYLSGFFGKTYVSMDGSKRWKASISVLLVGSFYLQIFDVFMGCIVNWTASGEWSLPTTIYFWDHLETWYLLALLIWRLMTPLLDMFNRPLLVSMVLAFLSFHFAHGEHSDLRMRIFRYFPYYVLGLTMNNASLDMVPSPTIVGFLGVTLSFLFSWTLHDKNKHLGLSYTCYSWSLEPHLILLLQYALCASMVLSVILLVRQISFPIFPFFHSQSTLAIYSWHWYVLPPLLYGKYPFSEMNLYQGWPLMEFLQQMKHHPIVAILFLHVTAYVVCAILGSKLAWKVLSRISDPDCGWMFRNVPSEMDQPVLRKTTMSRDNLLKIPVDACDIDVVYTSEIDSLSSQRSNVSRRFESLIKLV